MRNATRTAIAPTGTLSLIAGVTSGIEPMFSLHHRREISGIGHVEYFHPFLERLLTKEGHDVEKIIESMKSGNAREVECLPSPYKELYVPALEIEPEWHVKVQAAFQAHVDNSVSKTVNLREEASIEDVKRCFLLAHELHCKGITVYRNNSKRNQIIQMD